MSSIHFPSCRNAPGNCSLIGSCRFPIGFPGPSLPVGYIYEQRFPVRHFPSLFGVMSVGSQSSTLQPVPSPKPATLMEKDVHVDVQEITDPAIIPMDGGRDAWMTIAGTWLIQFCTYGYTSAFGVYQDFYTREFLHSKSPSDISWIGSFQLFMSYAPGVLVGRAFDAGYFHYMIVAGSAIQVTSMFMLSLARDGQYYQVFLAQALGMGLGQSLLFLPSLSIIGHHFKRRRAMATGIAVSGASVGGVIWPIMLNQLGQRTSFANGIRVTAGLTGVLLLTAKFIMKTKHLPKAPSSQPPTRSPVFQVMFRDTAYLISIGAAFCIGLGIFFPYFYLQLYAIDKGVNKDLAFYVIAIINAGSFFGRLLPNFFADKIGPYNMLIPCLVISSILIFSIFGVHSFAGVAIFGILYGFWSGSYVSLIPSLLAQLSTHVGEQGTRMGVAFSVVGIALLIGTPIEGVLVAGHGDYKWYQAIIFSGVMVISGAVGMTMSRHFFIRQNQGGERGSRV